MPCAALSNAQRRRRAGPEQVLAVLPLRLEEGIDAEIEAKARLGLDADDADRMDDDERVDGELDADGGNVAAGGRCGSCRC